MPDDTPRSDDERRGWTGYLVAVPVLLVLYALSPGPVMWMFGHGRLHRPTPAWLRVVYAPLGWLIENVEWVAAFYDWYLGLFQTY